MHASADAVRIGAFLQPFGYGAKIYTTETHGHLRAVRRDMAEGRMMVPKIKKG
jgi:hypothetical protein